MDRTIELSAAERDELLPTGRLRAAVAVGPAKSALWTIRGADGGPEGVTADLARALADRIGVPLDLVEHASSGAIIEAAENDVWDVAFTPVDAERKRHVEFGNDYFLGESTCLVLEGSKLSAMADADHADVRIVGVENTATIRSLRRAVTKAKAIGTTSLDEALTMLKEGKADAIALGRESLKSLQADLPGSRILDGAFHQAGTAIAVRKGRPAALAAICRFIEVAKADGTVRRALDAHGMADSDVAPAGSRS